MSNYTLTFFILFKWQWIFQSCLVTGHIWASVHATGQEEGCFCSCSLKNIYTSAEANLQVWSCSFVWVVWGSDDTNQIEYIQDELKFTIADFFYVRWSWGSASCSVLLRHSVWLSWTWCGYCSCSQMTAWLHSGLCIIIKLFLYGIITYDLLHLKPWSHFRGYSVFVWGFVELNAVV
jgi:hypothetical protein